MKYYLLFIAFIISNEIIAQQMIQGTVFSVRTNQPINGANVTVRGTNITVSTNENGNFKIDVPTDTVTLIFKHVAYEQASVFIKIPQANHLNVFLTENARSLDEVTVVATGYQKIPRERATGSFSTVNEKMLNQQFTTGIIERLEAVANGITVDRGTIPNNQQIIIRGLSTINGPKAPLIVLDNFPYEGDISNINPNLVENITILKDAAAASIWGARAANGVIVITTKTGKFNHPISIDLTSNLTISGKPDLSYIPQMSSSDFVEMEQELFNRGFYDNDINSPDYPVLSPVIDLLNKEKNGIISNDVVKKALSQFKNQDIRDQYSQYMYRNIVNQQYFINIQGGQQKYTWSSGIGFDNNIGNLDERYQRINIRFQNVYRPIEKLSINTSLYYTQTNSKSGRSGYGSITTKNNSSPPYLQIADADGNAIAVAKTYNQDYIDTIGAGKLLNWNYYPLNDWKYSTQKSNSMDILFNAGIQYSLLKGLNAEINYQHQRNHDVSQINYDEQSYYARNYVNGFAQILSDGNIQFIVPPGAILEQSNIFLQSNNGRGQLSYNQDWNKHRLTAIAGGEIRSTVTKSDNNRYYGVNDDNLTIAGIDYTRQYPNLVNGNSEFIQNGQYLGERTTRFLSFYSNVGYTYNDKYTISASARRDASNLFGLKTNDQWNPFWSTGLSWNISKERFYSLNFLPLLKLRATYGFSGNIDPAMVAVSTIIYDPINSEYTLSPMARFDNYLKPNLKWETSKMLNIGVDFASKGNRVLGSIEYFQKNGTNLFGNAQIDYTTGVPTWTLWNVANMSGKGVDIELKALVIDKGIKWNSILNASFYKDKVTKNHLLSTFASAFVTTGTVSISAVEGKPVYSIFGYRWAGLDPQTGDPQGYLDNQISKDYSKLTGVDTELDDLQYFGSAIPTKYGSFINSLSYKQFTLNFSIIYKFDFWFRRRSVNYTSLFTNLQGHSDYALRWRQPGDEKYTDVPSNVYETNRIRDEFYNGSSALIEKGDHIRLQYITMAYELNKRNFRSLPFKSLSVSLNANNLGILWRANKNNIDPDYYLSSYAIPPPVSYTIGLKAKF